VCGHGANSGSPWPKGVTIANASIAPSAGKVNRQWAAYRRDTRDGNHADWFQRPRVLEDLPLSHGLVFGAFVVLSNRRGELRISTRALAAYTGLSEAQVRRAIRRLITVRLIEVVRVGCGPAATVYLLRWRARSFPHPNASSSLKKSSSEKNHDKSNPTDTRRCPPQAQPSRLELPVSEQGRRWALGKIRRELLEWGIPGKARGELMAGIAFSLTRAIKTRKIRTGRELGQVTRYILATLDQDPELRASQLAKRDNRALYSGAALIVARAVARVKRDREAEQATKELLGRIRRERDAAKRGWIVNSDPLDGKRMPVGGGESLGIPISSAWLSPLISRLPLQNLRST